MAVPGCRRVGALVLVLVGAAVARGDGIDISYPQCGAPAPTGFEFAVIGVNGGRPFEGANPCLAQQVGLVGPQALFYANTANRGPSSPFWPNGQTFPKVCVAGQLSAECSEDYGWNAAADSYRRAVESQIAAGLLPPGSVRTATATEWWLDVESANTWQGADTGLNVAALRGAVAYLREVGVGRVGFYANAGDWRTITGDTKEFAGYASWIAGLDDRAVAVARCGAPGFTGGGVAMSQYRAAPLSPAVGLDGDVSCPVIVTLPATVSVVAGTRSAALPVTLNVVQGGPTSVELSTTLTASGSGIAATSGGPVAPALTVAIPATERSAPVYVSGTRSGVYTVQASAPGYPTAIAPLRVTVTPGAAVRMQPIRGPRVLRPGRTVRFTSRAVDRYGNGFARDIRWSSSNPRVIRVTALPGGAARIVARGSGRATVRARSGRARRSVVVTVTR